MSRNVQEVIIDVRSLSHYYGKVCALDNVSIQITKGSTVGLIGPDGVGKSTLLSLISGVKKLQQGEIFIFGQQNLTQKSRDQLSPRIAFMPQGLGKNLYFSLSIYENIDFIARLFSIPAETREQKIEQLLKSTGLYEFKDRPAGQLSGGMKQKLSLCCSLVHDPDILILDEPTTGVDPLSRKQFWIVIDKLRQLNPDMALIVATAYMEEAEQFEHQIGMFNGKLIFDDSLEYLLASTGANSIEDAFVYYLPEDSRQQQKLVITPFEGDSDEPPVIVAHSLTKEFGDFTAVDNVSFSIEKGEIFGFLGSNGCGKTTTMKMLTGLIEATSGSASLLGQPVNATDISTKMKIGYMSQLFSLYEELTVRENLILHAQLYQMTSDEIPEIIKKSLQRFDLVDVADMSPRQLSLGIQQRLQLAAACLHEPEVLILDEPTSGVDPVARDMFWQYLMHLSRDEKITIFVSTHFMNEAARCDRISFMDSGRVLAMGTPNELVEEIRADNLEDAFIMCLLRANHQNSVEETIHIEGDITGQSIQSDLRKNKSITQKILDWFSLTLTFARREMKEVLRDKVRIVFTFIGPLILLVCTVFCISFDIENIRFSVLDEDKTGLGYDLIQQFDGSRYFNQISEIHSYNDLDSEIKRRDIDLIVNIPKNYGKDLMNQDHPTIHFFIDGAQPFKASSVKQYISGIMLNYSMDWIAKQNSPQMFALPDILEPRFIYNPEFKTIYSIVPGMIMMALIVFTTMLTALGIVREKEKGSIINFYSSPARVTQYLVGKQLPYVGLTFLSGLILIAFSVIVVGVPYKGSLFALLFGVILYLFSVSALGLVISALSKGEITAMFLASILTLIPASNFSGLIYPVSTLTGMGYWFGTLFPATWFQKISIGVFNKGLGFGDLIPQYWALFGFGIAFIICASLALKKQEK